jgi:hypothetical protein
MFDVAQQQLTIQLKKCLRKDARLWVHGNVIFAAKSDTLRPRSHDGSCDRPVKNRSPMRRGLRHSDELEADARRIDC